MPIDYSEMYVLGLKRGYAIIPIIHKRGETEDQRREDVQNTLQKVRRANVMLGMTAGGATPQGVGRRKARLAGKVKRAVLEMGGMAHALSGTATNVSAAAPWTCRKGGEGRCWLFALMSCGQTPGKERRGSEGGVAAAAR